MTTTRTRQHAKTSRRTAGERAASPRGSRRVSTALVVLGLVVAGAVAYSTSFAGVFVFDDQFAIVENPNIKSLWPLTQAMSAPPERPVTARPIASLSLAVNYALAPADARDVMAPGGMNAPPGTTERFLRNVWGYHFMNLALHVLAALALVGVVRRTLLSPRLRPRFGAASTALAFVVALLWLVHPLTTDAVTYVTQRTEVLMGLFYLLTLYAAIRAAEYESSGPSVARSESPRVRPSDLRTSGPSDRAQPRRWFWTAAAIAACALGMGSKQTMVTAPFIVVAWDWIFRDRGKLGSYKVRWGLYAGLAATWLLLAALVAVERWPHSIGFDREGWTPWTYLLTQTGVIVHYVRLSVVPAPLVLDYDGWPMARSIVAVAPHAALLAVLVAATLFALVRRRPWSFAGAWFFALLAPSSSVLPLASEIAAERRMYTALASLVLLAVIGGYLAGQRLLGRLVSDARSRRTAGLVAAAVVVCAIAVAFGSLTYARNRDFWSDEGIWRDTVEKRPDNPRARLNYGVDLSLQRRDTEAEEQLREAVRLKDSSASAHGNLGAVLCRQGRLEEGVKHLERAVALDPDFTAAYGNLGEAYGALGQRALAAKYFSLAVKIDPESPFLLNRLAWLLATSPEDGVRDGAKAVEAGEQAARVTSRQDMMSLDTLAAAYAEAGRFREAVATASEAIALAEAQGKRGAATELTGRLSLYEAGQKYRESK